jgi:hypothetical protein
MIPYEYIFVLYMYWKKFSIFIFGGREVKTVNSAAMENQVNCTNMRVSVKIVRVTLYFAFTNSRAVFKLNARILEGR